MNEKELRLRQYELDVSLQETKVRDAKTQLDEGYKVLIANLEKEYAVLKSNYERALLSLERERACVEFAKSELSRGF